MNFIISSQYIIHQQWHLEMSHVCLQNPDGFRGSIYMSKVRHKG